MIYKFFLSLLLCLGGGWLTGLATREGVDGWYSQLIKPPGTPPNFVFPIVWTILYTLMAFSLALLWNAPQGKKGTAFFLFSLQLFLNFNWSWLFFALKSPGIALVDLTLLWVSILLTIFAFWRFTPLGSLLLIPYFAWVTYAFYLNFYIWFFS